MRTVGTAIRTLDEQLLWIRSFVTVEECAALTGWRSCTANGGWLVAITTPRRRGRDARTTQRRLP